MAKSGFSSVSDLRREYSSQGLIEDPAAIEKGPTALFKSWIEEAIAAEVPEPNGMCLSTCVNNKPSSRVVLLKSYDNRGFVWFTNYSSRKSEELVNNPRAALTFWWAELERQVRIEGSVEKVSGSESDAYFSTRPRGSQIGAWSSDQSSVISDRSALDAQEKQVQARFSDESVPVPRPPHWGGFRLVPHRIEFWKGRKSRMHDRLVFERDATEGSIATDGGKWMVKRLQP